MILKNATIIYKDGTTDYLSECDVVEKSDIIDVIKNSPWEFVHGRVYIKIDDLIEKLELNENERIKTKS